MGAHVLHSLIVKCRNINPSMALVVTGYFADFFRRYLASGYLVPRDLVLGYPRL